MGSHTSMVSGKNVTIINFTQSQVSIDFSCTVSEIHNIGYSQCISPWEVIRARFTKKLNGRKLCTKSSFDRFFMHCFKNSKYRPFLTY
ncbi:hypothetical protein BHE74_00024889 [Ensete ventricosum]|nr:hypothetical protein GW17_00054659 [Ensete ventricosum]RWW67647.1 hypothetical protein BHE74_00024889 [Ensete ventricosum]RZR91986.1 hypothetical protein BHM03_00020213 [Ensete ventricosum]